MYDIRQFKPAVYALLTVGISGFALAAQTPGIWLLGMAGICLNGWLVYSGRFRPLPRLVANLVTLACVGYIVHELATSRLTPVMVIGQFLVLLQLVKLWEQRANRDWAQLLILSLLLMVAASMSTASLWFGLLLVGYLFLSLYCCLLFHLKIETDAARAAMPVGQEMLSPGTLRQDQRYLSRSMRRLTGLVSTVAILFAVAVFIFFPRGTGAGMLGPFQSLRTGTPLTGFSGQVSFQDVARITQSHEKVAFVKVWKDAQPLSGGQTLLLRGLTLDTYRPSIGGGESWDWTRSAVGYGPLYPRDGEPIVLSMSTQDKGRLHQRITLLPTHANVLFALAGPVLFNSNPPIKVRFTPGDGAIETDLPITDQLQYDVYSTGDLGAQDFRPIRGMDPAIIREQFPRVYEFARQKILGDLADRRVLQQGVSDLDDQIATKIETYLRENFTYTLDLTDASSLRGRDPLVAFLYDWKRGHCEYFAGAMTLMCQSLGMQARLVIGFKCGPEEFNSLNDLYTVYDSDAHAWVEVRTPSGWKTYDPTSARQADSTHSTGLLARLRHLTEFLEYSYATTVIAYDSEDRQSIISNIENGMSNAAARSSESVSRIGDFISTSSSFWNASTMILSGVILAALGAVGVACGWFIWERWRLRRRAHRIGIESLPDSEQLRLARQLGFYDDMLRLLDRHRIERPAHLTPMEFSRSLTFLPSELYETIRRLTALFYKVRYGGLELPPARRRWLQSVLARLGHGLGGGVNA